MHMEPTLDRVLLVLLVACAPSWPKWAARWVDLACRGEGLDWPCVGAICSEGPGAGAVCGACPRPYMWC